MRGMVGGTAALFSIEKCASWNCLSVVYRFRRSAASPCFLTIHSGMRRNSRRCYGRRGTLPSSAKEGVLSHFVRVPGDQGGSRTGGGVGEAASCERLVTTGPP